MILDALTLSHMMNREDVADYTQPYLDGVIAGVQQAIADYLRTDPVLAVIQGEQGAVELDMSGFYSSLYRIQLWHAPLVPGPASSIFTALTLTYARSVQVAVPVNLAYVTVHNTSGEIFLSPGALSQLAGISFDLGGPFGYLQADGYSADYVAGYATGISDPQPNGGGSGFAAHVVVTNGAVTSVVVDTPGSGYTSVPFITLLGGGGSGAQVRPIIAAGAVTGLTLLQGGSGYTSAPVVSVASAASYGAAPIPANYTRAAALLCREQLAMDDALNADPANVQAGTPSMIKSPNQELRFASLAGASASPLGYGTALSMAAMRLLGAKRQTRIA